MGDRAAATALFNQGVATSNDKRYETNIAHAYQLFSSACYTDPSWWMAHYQCANNAFDLKFFKAAAACQRRALECDPTPEDRAKILSNLGMILYEIGNIEEAEAVSAQAVNIDNSLVNAWQNLSCTAGLRGDDKKAVEYARKALLKSNEHERVLSEALLSFALLFDRQFVEGFKRFEIRFRWRLHNFLSYPYAGGSWKGEKDKTIFLVSEQGLGDALSYARFVPMAAARARYLHICVQPELMRLFQQAFSHIKNINLLPSPSPFPQADHWSTFVSLPYALGLSDEQIINTQHIAYAAAVSPSSWKLPERKLHIGIAWGGSKLNDIDKHRNIPVEQFLDLYNVPGVQLYSLQVDGQKEDLHQRGCLPLIKPLDGYIRDVSDTLGLLPHLDLVITCESAMGHICALAGKECWIPYSARGHDYRIGHAGNNVMWAPKHRIFKQRLDDEGWDRVFREMVAALEERIACAR